MPTDSGSLSVSQARALRTLSYGGVLTKDQIRRAAELDRWEVGRALQALCSRGLIMIRSYDKRCTITNSGRAIIGGGRASHA